MLIVIFLFGFAIVGRITNSVELTSFLEIPSYLNKAFGQIDFVGELRTLHYDAWSELLATVKYVQVYGLTYGKQLLGVLFFFVPRSIWPDKPVGSGHLVAQNLLMTQYDMWFTNLSNPLPSEGYINFGIIGVALFAIILGKVSRVMDIYQSKNDIRKYISIYISLNMTFMLRGDLMSSFAYLIGSLLAMYVLPLFINNLITHHVRIKINVPSNSRKGIE